MRRLKASRKGVLVLRGSVEDLLDHVARRGSWYGGGSVAALAAAMACALLEKLILKAGALKKLKRLRKECLALVEKDAVSFARAIHGMRLGRRAVFVSRLKAATEVPYRVLHNAYAIKAMGKAYQKTIKPQFQSDVRCALVLAQASADSAETFIETNLAWLKERSYTAGMHKRIIRAKRSHAG